MPSSDALCWLAEEACMNAWPSPRQMLVGGFLLRASGGPTRRTNSVNPLRAATGACDDPDAVIETCERLYARLDRPPIFRVPGIAPEIDAPLERRGYARRAPSVTLLAALDGASDRRDPAVVLRPMPDADWLAARSRLNDADTETDRVYRAMTQAILLPKVFAEIRVDGAVAAMAYAALDRALVVIESVGTMLPMRGRGHARRVVAALMHWGRRHGAAAACLQVVADNRAARALYASLGFDRELFGYHYRRRDELG